MERISFTVPDLSNVYNLYIYETLERNEEPGRRAPSDTRKA